MIDKKITTLIGKAIREGRYLNITYQNRSGEITPFWISILDINAKVIDVFPGELNNPDVNKKEFDGVIFQGRMPKVVFEINGIEHFKNKKRIESDKIKMQLLHSKQIDRIIVPNHYVKHYEFIRELMNKIKGGVYQKTLFEG